jgi:hypothetical protein
VSFVARYLTDKDDLNSDGTPKRRAFTPRPAKGTERLELSVCDLDDRTEQELLEAGQMVAAARGKILLGRSEISKAFVVKQELTLERNDHPFRGHTNIVGWSTTRDAYLLTAMAFSKNAGPLIAM